MNELIALLTEKIPAAKQDNIFTFLLSIVKENNISELEQLKERINLDIGSCQNWLDENKEGSTVNDIRREYAKKLAHLKDVQELINNYL